MDGQPVPDAKDWTWVLERPCPECGFECAESGRDDLAALAALVWRAWVTVMPGVDDPARRPAPEVWSPLEYACHVRDVFALAITRMRLMLDEDGPAFANWDQDATAIEDDYAAQSLTDVMPALARAGQGFADLVASVPIDAWERTGMRSDGAVFTVESFTRYLLHDPVHHLTDVTGRRWPSSAS